VRGALADLAAAAQPGPGFSPGFELPPVDERLTRYFLGLRVPRACAVPPPLPRASAEP